MPRAQGFSVAKSSGYLSYQESQGLLAPKSLGFLNGKCGKMDTRQLSIMECQELGVISEEELTLK